MFRKILPIFAIGLGILALGAVKSEAQSDPVFHAIVGATVSTSSGTISYTIDDWVTDGVRYVNITYYNAKTKEHGMATEASLATASAVTSSGMAYSGSMQVGKSSRAFSLALDATSPSISFNLASAKGSAAVSTSNVLVAGNYSIYLNP